MLTRSIAIAASLLSGACALQGIAPSPAMAEEGAATCVRYDRDGVCTFWAKRNDTTGGEPGGTKKTQTVTKSASSCMWHGQKVPCSTSEGWYDAASGCYLSLQPDKPVIGPDPSTADPTILKYRCALIIIVIDGKPVTEAIFRSILAVVYAYRAATSLRGSEPAPRDRQLLRRQRGVLAVDGAAAHAS